jgi:hypothetical protein
VFILTLTGPPDVLNDFLMRAPIELKLVPPGGPVPSPVAPDSGAGGDPNQPAATDAEEVDEAPSKVLHIAITLASTPPKGSRLELRVDPPIKQGYSHCYYLDGASSATSDCDTGGGDPNLYLHEWNNSKHGYWAGAQHSPSVNKPGADEHVDGTQQWTGSWRLKVHAAQDSQYTLVNTSFDIGDYESRYEPWL